MTNKKNIKIKVKYPAPGSKPEKNHPAPGMITEWNVKRILLALGCVVLILVSLLFFKKDDDTQETDLQRQATFPEKTDAHKTASQTQAALPEKTDAQKTDQQRQAASPEKIVDASAKQKTGINNNVRRALLTFKINHDEPEGEITFPLKISNKKSTKIYYFVELTGMKGRTVYHEWLLDGKLISRKKVNISGNTWPTASRQMFYNTKHNWTVRLVDEKGKVINQIPFDVIFE